jgi:hypothetical protein
MRVLSWLLKLLRRQPSPPTPNNIMTRVVRVLIKGRVRLGDLYGTPIGKGGRAWCSHQTTVSILDEDIPSSPLHTDRVTSTLISDLQAQKMMPLPRRHPPIAFIYVNREGRLTLRVHGIRHLTVLQRVIGLINRQLNLSVDLNILSHERLNTPSWDPFAPPTNAGTSPRTP